jgi:hypothetical protein
MVNNCQAKRVIVFDLNKVQSLSLYIYSQGISLSVDQWKKLKSHISKIDADLEKHNK